MTRIVAFLSCNEFWNALSAIGSILASVTALWLARREHIKRIEAMLIWDAIEYYEPALLLFILEGSRLQSGRFNYHIKVANSLRAMP